MQTAQCEVELKEFKDRIWCLVWNKQGNCLAASGERVDIYLWVFASNNYSELIPIENNFTLKYNHIDQHTKTIRHLSWSPCGNYLASASFDSTAIIWKLDNFNLEFCTILEGHSSEVKWVDWSACGHFLATCGRDKGLWIWEFDDEEDVLCKSVLSVHNQDVKCVCWHKSREVRFYIDMEDFSLGKL